MKNNASLGSKINQNQTKKIIQIKEKKLNSKVIQNGEILVILMCLQAKLQLFQDYRSLFENFFCSRSKKLAVLKDHQKIAQCCKRSKKDFTQAKRALKIKHCCKHGS